MSAGVSTSRVGPCASTRPPSHQHQRVADRRGEVQVVRRQHHRHAALAVEPLQQRRDLELVAEVERRRRLVEQQHVAALRQRAGDDDALLLAAAERHVRRGRRGARCRWRPALRARSRGRRGLRAGTRPDAGAGPSAPSPARCSRRPDASPAARRRSCVRHGAAPTAASARPSSVTVPAPARARPTAA